MIGTHGKLKNWVSKRLLDLDGVVILVFDEADEMLKVGTGDGCVLMLWVHVYYDEADEMLKVGAGVRRGVDRGAAK